MLRINPLQPPRPFAAHAARGPIPESRGPAFVAADDYDSTGIMAGVDPSESRYWWLPELYGPETCRTESRPTGVASHPAQATSRTGEPTATAA